MSRTIDEKVVEMRFDNSNFEANVKQSMSTLDKLKSNLNFAESAKSFENIDKAANNIKFDGLKNGINEIKARISSLDMVANAVISRITNSVISLSSKLITAIPQQIIQGGFTRASNIENARFQLQGLIDDEKEVKAIMDQAGESVDGTAYSYDEAAKAASMFAASGLKSGEKMEMALKAIAGTAATVNADYSDISQIFTTIAGNGRVMAEQLNQFSYRGMNAAAAITKFFNEVNDGSVQASESVTDSIKQLTKGTQISEAELRKFVSESKISFEIFSEAMGMSFGEHAKDANKTFNGALSNIKAALSRTGEAFFTPLIQQEGPLVQFFNTIREKINEMNKAMKPFAEWSSSTFNNFITNVNKVVKTIPIEQITVGLTNIASSVYNIFKGLVTFIKPIGDAFSSVFKFDASSIVTLTERFKNFTSRLKASDSTIKNIKDGFKGIFDVLKLLGDGFIKLFKALFPTVGPIKSIGDGLLRIFGAIGRGLSKFTELVRGSETLQKTFEVLSNIIKIVSNSIKGFIEGVKESFHIDTSGLDTFREKLKGIHVDLEPLKNFFKSVGEKLGPVFSKLGEGLKKLGEGFLNALSSINPIKAFFTFLNGSFIAGGVASLVKLIQSIRDMFSAPKSLIDNIVSITSNISKYFNAMSNSLNAKALRDVAIAILLFAGACFLISTVDTDKLGTSLAAIGVMLGELLGAFLILQKTKLMDGKSAATFIAISTGLIVLGIAIAILAGAMKTLASLDNDQIANGLVAIGVLLAELIATMKILQVLNITKGITKIAFGLIFLGVALQVISKAVKILGELNIDVLKQGLISVGILLAELAIFTKIVGGTTGMFGIGAGILLVSLAIKSLIKSVESLGNIDFDTLVKALLALGAILVELGIFSKLASGKKIIMTSIGILILSQAIKQLIEPFKSLGGMTWESIMKGVIAFGSILTILLTTIKLIPTKKSITKVITFGLIVLALKGLFSTFKELGKMSWDSIARSLTAIGIVLAEVIGVISILSLIKKVKISTIITLMAIVLAIKGLVKPLQELGKMSWDSIARSLTAIGIVLAEVIGVISILSLTKGLKISTIISLLLVVIAIRRLAEPLQELSIISWDGIARSLTAMGIALLELVLAISVLQFFNKGGMKLLGTTIAILIMSVAMVQVGHALTELSKLDWDSIGRSLTAMGIALAIMISALSVMGVLAGPIAIGAGVLLLAAISLSISISVLSDSIEKLIEVVKLCTDLDAGVFEQTCTMLAKGISKLGIALFTFGPLSIIGAAALNILANGLIILIPAMKEYMAMDPNKLADTFVILGDGLSVFGKNLKSFGLFSGIGANSFYTVAEALNVLIKPMLIFYKMDMMNLSKSFETLGNGISEFGASLKSFGLFSGIGASSLLLMSYAVSMLAPALTLLSKLDANAIGNTMKIISGGFKEFAEAIDKMNLFSPAGAAAINILCDGVKKLADSLPSLISLGADKVNTVMTSIANAFKKFGEALQATPFWGATTRAKGIGALIDNIEKLTSSLPSFMELDETSVKNSMDVLATGFKGFGEALESTPFWFAKSRAEGIGKLCEEIGTLTSALPEFMELDANKVESSFVILGSGFTQFGTALQSAPLFSNDKGGGIANLIDSISTLTTGLQDFINADFDPEEVNSAFTIIANGFYKFGESLQSSPFFNVQERGQALVTIVGSIKELADGIEYFTNHTDRNASSVLESIGQGMKNFSDALKNTPWFKADERGESLKNVISMVKDLGDSMSYFKDKAGTSTSVNETLSAIGTALADFGTALKSTPFFESGNRAEALVTVIQNLGHLSDVLIELEKHNGDKLQNRFNVLSTGITNLGISLKEWGGIGFGSNIDNFSNFMESINSLLYTDSSDDGSGLPSIINSLQNVFTYQKGYDILTEFINGIKDKLNESFNVQIEGDTNGLSSILSNMKAAFTYESGYLLLTDFVTGLKMKMSEAFGMTDDTMATTGDTMGAALSGNPLLTAFLGSFTYESGLTFLTEFINGLKDSINTAFGIEDETSTWTNELFLMFLQGILDCIDENYEDFEGDLDEKFLMPIKEKIEEYISYDAGYELAENIADGIIDGLNDKLDAVREAAAALGNAVTEGTSGAVKVASPSKVFRMIGYYIDKGLALGIKENTYIATRSTGYLADNVTTRMNNVVSTIYSMINSNIDMQPTIAPVIDTTNIVNGARAINGIFASTNRNASITASGYNEMLHATKVQADLTKSSESKLQRDYTQAIIDAVNKSANTDTNVNVVLEGDAKGVFNLVRSQNDSFTNNTGFNPLARQAYSS